MQLLLMTWKRLASNSTFSRSVQHIKQLSHAAFTDKYLIYTNISISISLSSLGDILEQRYEIYHNQLDKWDKRRTMHMAWSGLAVGILCHNWYRVLDKFLVGKTTEIVFKKIFLDQMIFSPVMILTFFASVAVFEEDPLENFRTEIRDKYFTLYKAEWVIWPPAQLFNFYFLPTRFRVLYDNVISLGYDIYTSKVKHNKMEQADKDS